MVRRYGMFTKRDDKIWYVHKSEAFLEVLGRGRGRMVRQLWNVHVFGFTTKLYTAYYCTVHVLLEAALHFVS